jgi:hypothetical protein
VVLKASLVYQTAFRFQTHHAFLSCRTSSFASQQVLLPLLLLLLLLPPLPSHIIRVPALHGSQP